MARYKKDSRGYFYTTIELPAVPGTGRARKFIRAKSVARLKEKIEEFHANQSAGGAPLKKSDDHTYASWLTEWLEGERRRNKIRPSTYKRYAGDIRNHLIPRIGKLPLSPPQLDPLQRMADYLFEKGRMLRDGTRAPLAPRTLRNIMTPLIEALDAAKRRGFVRVNIAREVELPSVKEPDLYHITPLEMRRFLEVVRGTRFEAMFWLAMLGFREGELLGLRWSEVDLEMRTIKIIKGMQRVDQPEGGSKMEWIEPKTKRGKRTVKFHEDWVSVILEHRARQDEERTIKGWRENDLVFPSTVGTPMEASNFISRIFKPALTAANLPAEQIRFHDLRHGAASMLIALGYDARTIADILGHSSPEFTMRQYAASFEEQRYRATADVGELLRPGGDRILELPRRKEPRERG